MKWKAFAVVAPPQGLSLRQADAIETQSASPSTATKKNTTPAIKHPDTLTPWVTQTPTQVVVDAGYARFYVPKQGTAFLDSILILGTSDDMVEKIAERLGLPKPSRIIHIEDITTPAQRTKASKERKEDGTHIIPAPTFEVKRQFSGYFLDPKRSFRSGAFKKPLGAEKTVVRPTFSYLGHYEISDKVVSDIVQLMAEATPGVANVLWVSSQNSDEGMYIRVVLQFEYGCKVRTAALAMQRAIHDEVAYMTAFNVLGVEVEIRGFKFK